MRCAGIEGTSSYGAGVARYLKAGGVEVLEVERPKRRRRSSRRNAQKSDPLDAEGAARAALAGERSGVPKSGEGRVEMIRALRAARRSAIKARTQAANQLRGLRVTAPEEPHRRRLRGLCTKELVAVAARFRLGDDPSSWCSGADQVCAPFGRPPLQSPLGRDRRVGRTTRSDGEASRPGVGLFGGYRHRACRRVSDRGLKDDPERLRSEASFASLCAECRPWKLPLERWCATAST